MAKRKVASEEKESLDQVEDGRIIRIKLKNFLTYDDCEFYPGENLNVVLGPNGTGKSSIVCAICLGLGGSPSLLGRAKEVGDYVKHRTKQGLVEIELHKSKGSNLVIKRIIHKEKNRSQWFINDKESNASAVKETVAKLNVQMNNLCQFLPQDRVVEFAKMSPQQLLEATEKAVGPPGMFDDHMSLIEMRSKHKELELRRNEKEEARSKLEERNSLLEREVQRYNEREKHMEKIDMLEKKKPWAEYEAARLMFISMKKDKEELEKKVKEARKLNAPLEKEVNGCRQILRTIEEANQTLVADGNKLVRSTKTLNDKLEDQQDKIDEIKVELKTARDDEDSRQKRLQKLRKDIESLEKELDDAPDPEILMPRKQEMDRALKDLQTNINKMGQDGNHINNDMSFVKTTVQGLKSRLRQLENIGNRRLENLRARDKNAYDAVMWLRENKGKFSGEICEPIMTQINMKNISDARYLESVISFNDMKAFVCENREDQALFMNEMRDNQKLRVAAVCPPSMGVDHYQPRKPLSDLKRYGFKNYLKDLFDAPEIVMRYLCANNNVHNIPIGTAETERCSDKLMNDCVIPMFFTPTTQYRISKSKYSTNTTTQTSEVKKKGDLLDVTVDQEEKKRVETELKENESVYSDHVAQYKQIQKNQAAAQLELEKLRMEKKTLLSQLKRKQTIQNQIEGKAKRIQDQEKDAPNFDAIEKKASANIAKLNQKRIDLAKQFKEQTQKCVGIGREKLVGAMKQAGALSKQHMLEEKMRESSHQLQKLEEAFKVVTQKMSQQKSTAKKLLETARKKTDTAAGQELSDELKQYFDTLPNTIEDIQDMIHEEQARLNCSFPVNKEVIRDFERRKGEIQSMIKEDESIGKDIESINEQMASILERWETPLVQLIKRINEQYSDFFRRMGCAGQVSLSKEPGNEHDYRKFGVEIQVKFRAENKMKCLTSYYQSGGERSVSTMLYLISLQELTKCPFRLVDEINQGMDPNNERRVFELVVETVCRPNTSQYFLITPKLLPDLKYTDRMTILTVLNGHWMLPHKQCDVKQFIRRRKKLPQDQS